MPDKKKRIPGLKAEVWRIDPKKTHWAVPMNDPQWRSSKSALHMKKQDFILGIYLDGQAWALPWWILKNHHVANLILKDTPIVVSFCEACSSAVAFVSRYDQKRLTFSLAGRYNGSILTADQETGSYWNPFEGKALAGNLKGATLKHVPANQCTWEQWIALHPDSFVAYSPPSSRGGHGSKDYPGAENSGHRQFIRSLILPIDKRLPDNLLVLGLTIGGVEIAYPLDTLDRMGTIVQDEVSDSQIVIFHKPKTLFASAFSRRLRGEILNFEVTNAGTIIDIKTQSTWNLMGEAVEGPLKGAKLDSIRSGVAEWYIWAANHPSTKILLE